MLLVDEVDRKEFLTRLFEAIKQANISYSEWQEPFALEASGVSVFEKADDGIHCVGSGVTSRGRYIPDALQSAAFYWQRHKRAGLLQIGRMVHE